MRKQFYKEKTPSQLNQVLLGFEFFKEHWKLIPPTVRLLNQINHWNLQDEGASEVTWRRFHDLYGAEYSFVQSVLEAAGLIQIRRECIRSTQFQKGHCYQFQILPKAQALLADDTWEYLYRLRTDPAEKRKLQYRRSKRNNRNPATETIRMIAEVNRLAEFDYDEVKAVADKFPDAKRASVGDMLVHMKECVPADLKHNAKDNRIWHPYAQLPPEIKALIKVNNLPYLISMDIRSCYPSCWAEYVYSLFNDPDLDCERKAYNDIFLNRSTDPKTVLAELLLIPRNKIKEVMIKYFNGYKVPSIPDNAFYKFDQYLRTTFPRLFAAWQQTDIKQTGNNIGRMFETKLMQDGAIYDFTKSLGYVLGYEYDGMSIYGKDRSKLPQLYQFIEKRSVELLGFQLVLVDKDNRETLAQLMAKSKIKLWCEEIEQNEKKMASLRKFNFGVGKHSSWQQFYNLRDRNNLLIERIKPIANNGKLFWN